MNNAKVKAASTGSTAANVRKAVVAGLAFITTGIAMAQTPSSQTGTVVFGGQRNTGNQSATIEIQNVVVNDVEVNATAVGNYLSVRTNDLFNGNNQLQHNTGNQQASIAIRGAATRLQDGVVNATALGNNASYMGISTAGLNATTARQDNVGNQSAGIVWNEDPSVRVNLNASALGNNLSIGRQ